MSEKETICWQCKNYAKCSWADGIPVKGWKATPTEIIDVYGGGHKPKIVHSYRVEQCPQFVQDKRQVTVKEIAEIVGVSEREIHRKKQHNGIRRLKALLKDKGYRLYVYDDNKVNEYYIEKI